MEEMLVSQSGEDIDNPWLSLKRKQQDEDPSSELCDTNPPTVKQQRVVACDNSDDRDLTENVEVIPEIRSVSDDCKQDNEDLSSKPCAQKPDVTDASVGENLPLPVEADGGSHDSPQATPDPFGYTRGEEFTSEIYKIQIHNLPMFGFNQLKKRLTSLGLKPNKFKSPNKKVLYICFRSEKDKKEALQKLNGHVWKGKTLEAKEAAPIADPFLKKRQEATNSALQSDSKKDNRDKKPLSPEEAQERLRENVVPLWNVDYAKQLEMKAEKMKKVLVKIAGHHQVKDQFRKKKGWRPGDAACSLLPIIPSPLTSNYRNKNEFTIGYDLDGKTIKVGFRYGLYKDGTTAVGEVSGLGNIMDAAIPVVESFQKFLTTSKWSPFLQQTGTGHWQTLTVRTFHSGDIMAMVDFAPRTLDQTEIEAAKTSVKEFYSNGDGKDVPITSFYFRIIGKDKKSAGNPQKLELIFGESHVHESLLGLKFRISPEAFFQVNTQAAERLYSQVREWSEVKDTTTVLDICCGTGTIGLSMAKGAKEMVGIEMCKPAVEDARINATLNGISNATFYSAKVEDVISRIMASLGVYRSSSPSPPGSPTSSSSPSASSNGDVVAVVDPPRAGLQKNVIKTLRRCEEIQRLVYVSCSPETALENFIDLMRPSTGKHKGQPFTLVQAVPVDLFPGTMHCELVLLFTRDGNST